MKRVRSALGLTQKDMARKMGFASNTVISDIETGIKGMSSGTMAHLRTIERYELRRPVIYDEPVRPVEVWLECLQFLNSANPGQSIRLRYGNVSIDQVLEMAGRSKWGCRIEQNGAEIICTKLKG